MPQEYLEQVYRCVFDDELTAEARSVALAVYIDSAEVCKHDTDMYTVQQHQYVFE
jgi:hypothetical protein